MGSLRYLVPNALTSMSVALGLLSIQASLAGSYRMAAWWAMYCVLTDKLDGLAARALKASSGFGAQLDSFADFLSFGVAPATLVVGFFASRQDLGWTEGWRATALRMRRCTPAPRSALAVSASPARGHSSRRGIVMAACAGFVLVVAS